MKKYTLVVFLLFCIVSSPFPLSAEKQASHAVASAETANWQDVVEYARDHLSCEGYLMAKADGFVYVKVDDKYIHDLFPLLGLEEEGYKEPPYFRKSDAPGAHISVFYETENILPSEIGQSFTFELKQIVIVKPARGTSYAVLQVEAPELERLRQKYGLSAKLFGHEYHISIAKKTSR